MTVLQTIALPLGYSAIRMARGPIDYDLPAMVSTLGLGYKSPALCDRLNLRMSESLKALAFRGLVHDIPLKSTRLFANSSKNFGGRIILLSDISYPRSTIHDLFSPRV